MIPVWLSLLAKMATSAGGVVAASLAVERAGPVIGALIATLPISAGPAYAFLAMDHGPEFLARSTLALDSASQSRRPSGVALKNQLRTHAAAWAAIAGANAGASSIARPNRSAASLVEGKSRVRIRFRPVR